MMKLGKETFLKIFVIIQFEIIIPSTFQNVKY